MSEQSIYYKLDEHHNVVPCSREEAKFGQRVAYDRVGKYRVSTVFLVLSHGYKKPMFFETMIFKGKSWTELYGNRYATWDEAVEGHKQAVKVAEEWARME